MKQLTCEMCGSTDLMKQDGVFVCQSCNCKYPVEEAKKMMVEGTVKIDNSDKLKNLYQIARRAKDNNDSENAVKYYDKILQEDPNSWEATFYNVYYRAMQTKIAYIVSAAESIQNILPDVFGMIKEHVEDFSERKLAIAEIAMRVTAISALLESSARSTFKESWDSAVEYSVSTAMEYFHEYGSRNKAVYTLLQVLGTCVEIFDDTDEDFCKLAVEAYKDSLQYFANNYLAYDDHDHNKKIMEDSIGSRIRKYEPNYVFPSPNTNGYPYSIIKTINKANNTSSMSTNNSSTSSNSGGCYVATAVYGSYDCPEVWTLRRYRDNQLAKSWYGRLFIHIYYTISPTIVKWFGDTEWFKGMWKGKLDNMVKNLQEQGVENTPYEDKNW